MSEMRPNCDLCGEPMPQGEEMFKFHGYSGNCPKQPLSKTATGIELIALERSRQIVAEGWTPAHDDMHIDCQLLDAAICYLGVAGSLLLDPDGGQRAKTAVRDGWPWEMHTWKPSDDPIRNLVKAGALIAAEIDRLHRLRGNAIGR